MKPHFKIIVVSLFTFLFIIGCKKGPSNLNTNKTDVYAAGDIGGKATLWKNGIASTLGDGLSIDGHVIVSGGDVYVSGGSNTSSGADAFYYKNGTRIDLGAGETLAIAVSGTDVYLAGMVLNTKGYPEAAYWKNGILTNLGIQGNAYAIAVSGNDIYIAGQTADNAGAATATYWKNGVPVNLGHGLVSSIAVQGNDVYLGGYSANSGYSLGGYWKNGNFVTIANNGDADIYDIKVSGSDVYLAGYVSNHANDYAAYWKNGVVTVYNEFTIADGIAISGNDVYVVGNDFIGAGNSHNCYLWKNNAVNILANEGNIPSIFVVAK